MMNACSNTMLSFFIVNNTRVIHVRSWVRTFHTLPASLRTSGMPNGYLNKMQPETAKNAYY